MLRPFRAAVCGAGPSGFYTAKYLLKAGAAAGLDVSVRLVDARPAPYGLSRYGVAPDHPEVKRVENEFAALMADHRGALSYTGGVRAEGAALDALRRSHDAVVLCTGAAGEYGLGIEGEHLDGVVSARRFVHWYNGDPDEHGAANDVGRAVRAALASAHGGGADAVVVGHGNVALDCARVLLAPAAALAATDAAAPALEALRSGGLAGGRAAKRVSVVGRRGYGQAAFTIKELRELTRVPDGSDAGSSEKGAALPCTVRRADLEAGATAATAAEAEGARPRTRLNALLAKLGADEDAAEGAAVRFHRLPRRVLEDPDRPGAVGAVEFEVAALEGPAGAQKAVGTGVFETVPCALLLHAVGWRVTPTEGVAWDASGAFPGLPHDAGRVRAERGLYVAGWAKRGATGIIGTNIGDAKETAAAVLADAAALVDGREPLADARHAAFADAMAKCVERGEAVDWDGWLRIDAEERERGARVGKPREKVVEVAEMRRLGLAATVPRRRGCADDRRT